jgi:hypothetical protein
MARAASDPPCFARKLLRCDAFGTYGAFAGRTLVRFFADRIEVGSTSVPYAYLVHLRAVENVLHVAYTVADGTTVEEYFRYDALTKRRAAKVLGEAVRSVDLGLAAVPLAAPAAGAAVRAVDHPVLAAQGGQRTTIEIRDPSIYFPPVCPRCGSEASSVDLLHASRGLAHRAAWVVPVCDAHSRLGDAIEVIRWSATVSGATLSFADPAYAQRFRELNQAPEAMAHSWSRLRWELERGTRFVVFQFAIAVVHLTFLGTSRVYKLAPDEQRHPRGLRYSAFSSLFGWWSLTGPFFTVAAIRTNLRGGIDLTGCVGVLSRGEPAPSVVLAHAA